ncbi:MAG: hypothetical protein N3A66_08385, partial [Planctomycetota bacterium]|nr:hypothetical protein [Planctomycetota bacterium]
RLRDCLALHLQDRLKKTPGVETLSEEWASAVFYHWRLQGAQSQPDIAAFRAYAPVDVVLYCQVENDKLLCALVSAAGARAITPEHDSDLKSWLQAVAQEVGQVIGLNPETTASLADVGSASSAMIEAALLSRCIVGQWVTNSGDAQLNYLRPFIQNVPEQPFLASAELKAGIALSGDERRPENANRCVEMLRIALVATLGTRYESDARDFVAQTKYGRETLEKELLELVAPLAADEMDMNQALSEEGDDDAAKEILQAASRKEAPNLDKQLGALRCLAAMKSARLADILPRLAEHDQAAVRQAAASALSDNVMGHDDLVEKLAADKNPAVAFAGKYAAWRRGKKSEPALLAARERFDMGTRDSAAIEILAEAGADEDEARLRKILAHGTAEERQKAFSRLARLKRLRETDFRLCLASAEHGLLSLALQAMTKEMATKCRQDLVFLANQPYGKIAEAARQALWPLRPTEPQAQIVFDLEVEHLYLRLRAIERLRASKETWSIGQLQQAAANRDPQVRAQALLALWEKSPAAANEILPKMLHDPN